MSWPGRAFWVLSGGSRGLRVVANPPLGPVRVAALVQEHVCRAVGEGVWLDGSVGGSGLRAPYMFCV
jgi:hypothetical protein